MTDVLLIIAEKNYQDLELENTRKSIEQSGLTIEIASKTKGTKKGKLGGEAEATISLTEVNVSKYKAIAFIGGPGSSQYFNDGNALKIASDSSAKGKIVAAICIAPIILANAGILKQKKATVWDDENKTYSRMIEQKGAIYTGKDVEKDNNIITANGPNAASKFGKAIAESIK